MLSKLTFHLLLNRGPLHVVVKMLFTNTINALTLQILKDPQIQKENDGLLTLYICVFRYRKTLFFDHKD